MSENKTGKYFKYAIGEILLVMIGILLALQVNNWNEERKKMQLAKDFSLRLIDDISADLSNINERITFFEKAKEYGNDTEKKLNNQALTTVEEQWEFIVNVFHTSQTWPFRPTTAAYTEIQNSGLLGFVGSPELVKMLAEFYIDNPVQLNQLTGGTMAYRDYVRSVIPIQLQDELWNACYDMTDADIQSFRVCDVPKLYNTNINEVYSEIMGNPTFEKILTRRLSTIYVRNTIYEGMANKGNEIISDLKNQMK